MKRLVITLAVLGLVAVSGWYGYQRYRTQQEQVAAEAAAAQENVDGLDNVIWASGKLEPVHWAALNPVMSGKVTVVHVQEGDRVGPDDLLVELDDRVLAGEVTRAEAAVAETEAALDKLTAGATAAEIAAAEADLAAADAAVAQAAGAMLEADAAIDTAIAQATMARREYAELASHPTSAESMAAQAEIAVAEAAVKQAQAAYNLVRGNPQIGALPESRMLNEATAALEVAGAQAALVAQGATPQQLAVAASAIDVGEAQVSAAESRGPGVEAGVQSALSRRDSARAALDKLLSGATDEDIAIAEARVRSAVAALDMARDQVAQDQIRAPFEGQIGVINVRPGEMTVVGTDAVIMGDTREMHIKTTDLRETDVVNVRQGMTVEVTFDALPDQLYRGTVTRIAPISSLDKGSTNYTIYVVVPDLDDSLRWGMTAFVNIQIDGDATGR